MSPPTLEQLHTFHAQERELFSILVLRLSRFPAESLLVMATWLWLEDFGFENIFSIIMALTDPVITVLANEAVLCFRCLDSSQPPNDFNQIPLTTKFMTKDISLHIIYKYRYSGITGIKNFLTTVCSRIFSDILERVLPSSSSSSFAARLRYPLIIPGFPHPTFGSINVLPDVVLPNNNIFLFPSSLWEWNAICIATMKERSIFITFSRGVPVSQAEVMELFTKEYGENCVESIYMQEENENAPNTNANSNGQQSLYARLVLDSVATVDRVLNGNNMKKFQIHKKHVWARKYEKRDIHT